MRLEDLQNKYPAFKHYHGWEDDEHCFSIREELNDEDIVVTLTLKGNGDIEREKTLDSLLKDESFISWLDNQWSI